MSAFKATHYMATCSNPKCGKKFLKAVEDTGNLCDQCCVLRDAGLLDTTKLNPPSPSPTSYEP